jgi:hypothetical protein
MSTDVVPRTWHCAHCSTPLTVWLAACARVKPFA